MWNDSKDVLYIYIINSFAPMEAIRLKHRNNPWMDYHIIELIYKREYLKIKAINYKNLTLSHIYNPPWLQVLMVVKVNFFGGGQTAHVVLILQQLNKTLSKHILKLDDVTNNHVLCLRVLLLF